MALEDIDTNLNQSTINSSKFYSDYSTTSDQSEAPFYIQPTSIPQSKMHHRSARTTRTTTSRPGLMTRLRARRSRRAPATTTTTTTTKTTQTTHGGYGTAGTAGTAGVHHHRRRPSMGDKVSGAMMKLRGTLTRRPGLKVRFSRAH
jgi:hypothetical protein